MLSHTFYRRRAVKRFAEHLLAVNFFNQFIKVQALILCIDTFSIQNFDCFPLRSSNLMRFSLASNRLLELIAHEWDP